MHFTIYLVPFPLHVHLCNANRFTYAMLTGSGKTTLLNVVGGYTKPADGSIMLYGQKMSDMIRRKISYVMQSDVFFPNLTLRETLTVRSRFT